MIAIIISIVLMILSCILEGWWVIAVSLITLSYYILSFIWAVDYASSLSYFLSQDLLSWGFNLLSVWVLFLVVFASFSIISNSFYNKEFMWWYVYYHLDYQDLLAPTIYYYFI